MILKKIIFLLVATITFAGTGYADTPVRSHASKQYVYGAGPSTKIVELFFSEFSKRPESKGFTFTVPSKSTKHAGGIRASGKYFFGRLGRPLSAKERALNKDEIILGQVPAGYATGSGVQIQSLTLRQLSDILHGKIKRWSEVGGPDKEILVIGREKTEAVLTQVAKKLPFLNSVEYQQVFKRDHTMVNFLSSPPGRYAIGLGALSNFSGLNTLRLEGIELGVPLGLVYDLKNRDAELVRAVKRFASDNTWAKTASNSGYYPP